MTDAERLTQECEAFLSGHWAKFLDDSARAIPLLGWLNVMAHGSVRDIRSAARWSHLPFVDAMTCEVLRAAPDDETLRRLQQEALIPLELRLLRTEDRALLNSRLLLSFVQDVTDAFSRGGSAG